MKQSSMFPHPAGLARVRGQVGRWPALAADRLALSLVGLAFGLRLFRLGWQSMWFDEAARLLMARAGATAVLANAGGDTLPPLFHLVMVGWLRLGEGDFWLRLPAAWSGTMVIAVMYALGRQLFDRRVALLAAALTAVFPYFVYQSQQANLYSQLLLLSAAQFLAFVAACRSRRWGPWLAYGLAALAGWTTHYFAALVTLALHLAWLVAGRRRRPGVWRRLLLVDLAVLLAFAPQVGRLLAGLQDVSAGFWLGRPSVLAPFTTLVLFTTSYSLPVSLVPWALLAVVAWIGVTLLEAGYRSWRGELAPDRLALLLLLALLPVVVVWLVSQRVPIYLERTLLVAAPGYVLLLAVGLAGTRRRSPLPYIAAMTVGLSVVSLGHYFGDPAFGKPGYRQAAAYISAQQAPGDVIVHLGNGAYVPFLLYLPPADHFLLSGDPAPLHPPGLHRLAGGRTVTWAELAGYRRLWLVVALDHSVAYQEETAAAIDARLQRLDAAALQGVDVRAYRMDPEFLPPSLSPDSAPPSWP